MVLGYRHNKPCPRSAEEIGPGLRIVLLRLKHGDKIFIAKLALRPIGFNVMFKFWRPLEIHIPRIPFISKGWHAVQPPVNKYAKFLIQIPIWCLILFERSPGWFKHWRWCAVHI